MPPRTRAHVKGSRLTDWDARCDVCRMPRDRCLCDRLPRLATRAHILVVMHVFEVWKTTNTGVLATRCLTNADVALTGVRERAEPTLTVDGPGPAFVLFPSPDAMPISSLPREGPLTLVVPDGNWRQARKLASRVPTLAALPRVRLDDTLTTGYALRTSTHPSRTSTMEAIAHALAITDAPSARDALLAVFDEMVARTLAARGQLARSM